MRGSRFSLTDSPFSLDWRGQRDSTGSDANGDTINLEAVIGECRSAGWRSVSRPTLSIRKAPKTGDDFGFSAGVEAGNNDSATRAVLQISGMPAVAGQNPAVAQTVLAPARLKFFAGTPE